jgi:hypothetical protein
VNEVVFYKDKDLQKRWHCSGMKLWRMRKDGKLRSIQLGGCGPYLTSEAEVRRVEEPPPENASAANSCSTRSDGGAIDAKAGNQSNSTDSLAIAESQASMNGGA